MAIRIGNGIRISGLGMPTSMAGVNNTGAYASEFNDLLTREISELNRNDRRNKKTVTRRDPDDEVRRALVDFNANDQLMMKAMDQSIVNHLKAEGKLDEDYAGSKSDVML